MDPSASRPRESQFHAPPKANAKKKGRSQTSQLGSAVNATMETHEDQATNADGMTKKKKKKKKKRHRSEGNGRDAAN